MRNRIQTLFLNDNGVSRAASGFAWVCKTYPQIESGLGSKYAWKEGEGNVPD